MKSILNPLILSIALQSISVVGYAETASTTASGALLPVTVQTQDLVTKRFDYANTPINYDSLPNCPNDPNLANATQPTCPDSNGNLPSGAPSNCYNVCKVTRKDYSNSDGSHTVTNATCPVNYSQIASFNSQPQYVYYASPPVKGEPMSWSDYSYYSTHGYNCWLSSLWYWNNCGLKPGNAIPSSVRYEVPATIQIRSDQAAGMYYYENLSMDNLKCWYRGSNCTSQLPNKLRGDAECLDGVYDTKVGLLYGLYSCQPPPGLYGSGYNVEVSLVCARNITSWQPTN